MRPAPLLAMTMSLLGTACSHQDTQLDVIARELETTVNRCVIDVRDKTSPRPGWPSPFLKQAIEIL